MTSRERVGKVGSDKVDVQVDVILARHVYQPHANVRQPNEEHLSNLAHVHSGELFRLGGDGVGDQVFEPQVLVYHENVDLDFSRLAGGSLLNKTKSIVVEVDNVDKVVGKTGGPSVTREPPEAQERAETFWDEYFGVYFERNFKEKFVPLVPSSVAVQVDPVLLVRLLVQNVQLFFGRLKVTPKVLLYELQKKHWLLVNLVPTLCLSSEDLVESDESVLHEEQKEVASSIVVILVKKLQKKDERNFGMKKGRRSK